MLADIGAMLPGDVLLLHGCCHNPTGADPRASDWERIADAAIAAGVLPFVDLAYQGFGDGLDEDAAGLRLLAAPVPELVVACSCPPEFALIATELGRPFCSQRRRRPQRSVSRTSLCSRASRIDAHRTMGQPWSGIFSAIPSRPPRGGASLQQCVVTSPTSVMASPGPSRASDPLLVRGLAVGKGMFALFPLPQTRCSIYAKSRAFIWCRTGAPTSPVSARGIFPASLRRSETHTGPASLDREEPEALLSGTLTSARNGCRPALRKTQVTMKWPRARRVDRTIYDLPPGPARAQARGHRADSARTTGGAANEPAAAAEP